MRDLGKAHAGFALRSVKRNSGQSAWLGAQYPLWPIWIIIGRHADETQAFNAKTRMANDRLSLSIWAELDEAADAQGSCCAKEASAEAPPADLYAIRCHPPSAFC